MTGLVLEGGGVKGSYQVGAYLAFKKCHIKVDGIVGTSIGAFNAAVIVSGKEEELYNFWKTVDVGQLLGLNKNYVKSVNDKKIFNEFIYGLAQAKDIVVKKGIDPKKLKQTLDLVIDEDKIRASKMDFGLCTVKLRSLKPVYIFKEDMEKGKMNDYILASANLPVFKMEPLIDGHYYVDGGVYDNSPANMLIKKGYDKIYVVKLNGIGRAPKPINKDIITYIEPSKFLGGTLNASKEKINENIKLGYYDTLKIIKHYDGYNFIFKKKADFLYNIRVKKVNDKLLLKVKKYFGAESNKEAIIKALEYAMIKENLTYYDVYSTRDVIKYIKKESKRKHFVYEFIRRL